MFKTIRFILILSVGFFVFHSCNSWRNKLGLKGNNEDARRNVIIDFLNSKSSRKSKFKVYSITEFDDLTNKYCFSVFREHNIYPSLNDTIGGYAKTYFPTNFIEMNGNLFLWDYAEKNIITIELVKKLQEYDIIDSLYYKIASGKLSKDNEELIITNGKEKATSYFICKNNIFNYSKIVHNKTLVAQDYLSFECN